MVGDIQSKSRVFSQMLTQSSTFLYFIFSFIWEIPFVDEGHSGSV
jgi:hypothetical protein